MKRTKTGRDNIAYFLSTLTVEPNCCCLNPDCAAYQLSDLRQGASLLCAKVP